MLVYEILSWRKEDLKVALWTLKWPPALSIHFIGFEGLQIIMEQPPATQRCHPEPPRTPEVFPNLSTRAFPHAPRRMAGCHQRFA